MDIRGSEKPLYEEVEFPKIFGLFNKKVLIILSLAICLIGVIYIGFTNYLLFHCIIELFSILIAFMIFLIIIKTNKFENSQLPFTILCIAYGFIGCFDLLHTLAYTGMGVFPEYSHNLSTQLWIIPRYFESISLLLSCILFNKRVKIVPVFCVYLVASVILLASVFWWGIFPECYVEGSGLTAFKKISEYIISAILTIGVLILFLHRKKVSAKIFWFLVFSTITTIFSEISFVFYIQLYGLLNILGHIFKLISFYLIYKAIVESSLLNPYFELQYNKKKEQELLEILDASTCGSWIADLRNGIVKYSPQWQKILGVENILFEDRPRYIENLVHPEDRQNTISAHNSALEGKRAKYKTEYRIKTLNEEYIWVLFQAKVFYSEAGVPIKVYGTCTDITDSKQVEEKLRESENKYRTMIETAGEGIVMAKPEGNYYFVNQRMVDMRGYPIDEILGKSSIDFSWPDWHPQVMQSRRELHQGDVIRGEFRFLRKDGSEFWTAYNATPVFSQAGEHVANFAMHTDITEHKRVEEEALELIDGFSEGSWIVDREAGTIKCSEKWAKRIGLNLVPANEQLGYTHTLVYPGDTEGGNSIEHCMETGATCFDLEYRVKTVDSGYIWTQNKGKIVYDRQGKATKVYAATIDITEHKQAEEALRESENRYRELVENANSIIIRMDKEGIISHFNEYAQNYFGYSRKEAIGMNVKMLVPPIESIGGRDLEDMTDHILANPDEFVVNTNENVKKNGERVWVSWRNKAIRNSVGDIIGNLAIGQDVSQLKQAEEALRESEQDALALVDDLEKADKNKNEFISVLSHELRNPLAAIVAGLSLMDISTDTKQTDKSKEIIKRQIGQLCKLVDDLLDLTRITQNNVKLKKETINLNEIIKNSIEDIRPEFEKKGVKLGIRLKTHPIYLNADPVRITQIIGNILFNALKFTQKGRYSMVDTKPGER